MSMPESSGAVVVGVAAAASAPGVYRSLARLTQRRAQAVLGTVLERGDDALFDLAQNTIYSTEQQVHFDALRELRRQRTAIDAEFGRRLDAVFADWAATRPAAQPGSPVATTGLSLLDGDALEEQLACERLADVLTRRHQLGLERLARALARLFARDVAQAAELPFAPAALVQAFREALAPVLVPIQTRLLLYKLFERTVQDEYGALLDALLDALRQGGVAADRVSPRQAAVQSRSAAATNEPMPRGPAANADDVGDADALFQALRAMFGDYLGAVRAAQADASRNLRSDAGVAAPSTPPPAAAAPPRVPALAVRQSLAALSALQADPPDSLLRVLDEPQLALAGLLQQQLLQHAERLGLAAAGARLAEADEQALALVGMLFDVLLEQRNYPSDTRRRFVRLSLPYAKAALLDRRLFAQKSHPARRLLNALAEACEGNQGDTPAERELLEQAHAICDRLLAEFNEDLGLFTTLEAELRTIIERHRRRMALAERRAAEAQRGRERLEQARATAAAELKALLGGNTAPAPLARFLSEQWTHHLAMVALREGNESEAYHQARAAGQQLWQRYCQRQPGPDLHELLRPVLASCGHFGEAVNGTVEALQDVLAAAPLPAQSAANETEPAPVPTAPDAPPSIEAETSQTREQLAALQPGDWVEFVDDAGQGQPAKLSWISPISQRRLFVNRRGTSVCVASLDELAAMVDAGQLRLRIADSAFDRALGQLLGRVGAAPRAGAGRSERSG